MYAITMLKKEQAEFVQQCNNNGCGRNLDFTIALGKVLADRIDLPSSPVAGSVDEYYFSIRYGLFNTLNKINEIIVIDNDRSENYIRVFYQTRYNLVYGNKCIIMFDEDQLYGFFGLNKYIDKITLEEIKKSGKKIMYYYNELSKLIDCLDALEAA